MPSRSTLQPKNPFFILNITCMKLPMNRSVIYRGKFGHTWWILLQWAQVFPTEQMSETKSALFVKKLLAISVSTITYLRAIFPEHAFGDRALEGKTINAYS